MPEFSADFGIFPFVCQEDDHPSPASGLTRVFLIRRGLRSIVIGSKGILAVPA
jgi:hypothetical protein